MIYCVMVANKIQIPLRVRTNMSDIENSPSSIFGDFLAGLIALDEELKKPENIDPYFRNMEDAGGIHYWQLNQYIAELASELIVYEAQFDALETEWKQHDEFWGRFLGPAAIQYARNLIADPEYQDEEFAMDWVVPSEENPGSE